jgi:thioredoxin reductase
MFLVETGGPTDSSQEEADVTARRPDEQAEERTVEDKYDVVVIGGGAAGLSGAVALARARRSVLVIDAGAPRNAPAGHVHNYLARDGIAPGELLAAGRSEVVGYGGEVITGNVITAQRLDGEGFRVVLADGRAVQARRLLVTTGLVDELPEVSGLAERWGRDVLHCPYCHGWEVRDQAIGVLASGPMAVHQALLFRQLSADVALFVHNAPDPGIEQREQLAARGIAVVEGEVAALEVTDDQLTGVRLSSGEVVPRQVVVVGPRFTARAGVLTALGLQPAEERIDGHVIGTFVPADPTGATAVPGVWVAGNVADLRAQVISAAAAGLTAGAAVNADLIAEDTRHAVAAYRSKSTVGVSSGTQ